MNQGRINIKAAREKLITRRSFLKTASIATTAFTVPATHSLAKGKKTSQQPNILWILAEDASPHIGCYGETAIETPNLDALADEGVRFENVFVTCPVCSPSRSALVTGLYQTTLGAHNHRSQTNSGKGKASPQYYDSFELPESVPLISDLFRKAGYYITNGAYSVSGKYGIGKTDYNFISPTPSYDGTDWRDCPEDKPFFAQIQLHGGKDRNDTSSDHIKNFTLPPYYPDHKIMRDDWITYLNSWRKQDRQVGEIVEKLKQAGELDNTVIFFLTDHGISHIRGKQFLYDEGIRIPLIIRFPDGHLAKTVRDDLVLHIDLAPTSLALAGIEIPKHFQSYDLFAKSLIPRDFIIAARDRCDETLDVIRCVRSQQYKYIRNFMSYRPHTQPSRYKDAKQIVISMKKLHKEGTLNELQRRIFNPTRPTEELYDLQSDPFEINNLAANSKYTKQLEKMRTILYNWMAETNDLGLIPEPIAEDLGKKYGNKYNILQAKENKILVSQLIKTIEAGNNKDLETLRKLLKTGNDSQKYWTATWLGINKDRQSQPALKEMTKCEIPALRIASLLALYKIAPKNQYLEKLTNEINNPNAIVGMYAMNAIEQTEVLNKTTEKAADIALKSDYNFTKRYAVRLKSKFKQ
jgi:arylsulfatase A-like enzyme